MKMLFAERLRSGFWSTVRIVESVLDVAEEMYRADVENRPWRLRDANGRVFSNQRHMKRNLTCWEGDGWYTRLWQRNDGDPVSEWEPNEEPAW